MLLLMLHVQILSPCITDLIFVDDVFYVQKYLYNLSCLILPVFLVILLDCASDIELPMLIYCQII